MTVVNNMAAQKTLSLSLALGFVLINMTLVCMGILLARYDMPGFQCTAAEGDTQPMSCCSKPEACPCQVSQGWPSQLPDSSVSVVPKVTNLAGANITHSARDVPPPLRLQSDSTNKIWKVSAGPSLALYLQNLPFLC